MKRVLLAYYSKTGSTLQIINQIADQLTALEANCTVLNISEVSSVKSYDLIIIGAPINGFQLVPQAVQFITSFEKDLSKIPTAVFTLSYLGDYARPFFKNRIAKSFNTVVQPITPFATAIFGGISNGQLPKFIQWVFGVPSDMPADTRDFKAIEEWSKVILNKYTSL